jgi:HEAT repeat protein
VWWRQRRRIKRLEQAADVEGLRAALRDEGDDGDRGVAAVALRRVAGPGAADDLLDSATTGGYWTRLAAIRELTELGDIRAARPAAAIKQLDFKLEQFNDMELLDMLTDEIARLDPAAAVASLADLLADPSPVVRFGAVQALGKLNDAQTRPVLERALADTDKDVRGEAAIALAVLSGETPASEL